MKKVLFVVTKDDVGGAQKYVQELASHLDAKKFTVKILAGGKGGLRFLSNSLKPYLLFMNDLLALGELIFVFRRERPDIVHLNSSKAGVIGAIAAKLAGAPRVIFTAHGWVFNPDNNLSWIRREFYTALHKIAARFQDKIISVSKYDNDLAAARRIASPEKLHSVYNGIDYANLDFLDKKAARKALTAMFQDSRFKIQDSSPWIGSVGRLVGEKNYETLVEAAAGVSGANFFIIGSGPLKRNLEFRIKNLGLEKRFFIVDELAPAAPYLKAFDVFVLTSIKEGLPYTLLEAMAAETPLVVTRIGGMTEVVQERGLVMPPREPEEIARAIQHYLDHPEEAKRNAVLAKKYLAERLTLERMVRETEQIYESR